jgi:hypothetical protein
MYLKWLYAYFLSRPQKKNELELANTAPLKRLICKVVNNLRVNVQYMYAKERSTINTYSTRDLGMCSLKRTYELVSEKHHIWSLYSDLKPTNWINHMVFHETIFFAERVSWNQGIQHFSIVATVHIKLRRHREHVTPSVLKYKMFLGLWSKCI